MDALIFATHEVEDNHTEHRNLPPWKRRAVGRTVEFSRIVKNSLIALDSTLSYDAERDAILRKSAYYRDIERISAPDKCTFKRETLREFSRGDSLEDFSFNSELRDRFTLNLVNAYELNLDIKPPAANVVIRGPRVVCYVDDDCDNEWSKQVLPNDYHSYSQKPPSVERREKALALVKKACPGRPY